MVDIFSLPGQNGIWVKFLALSFIYHNLHPPQSFFEIPLCVNAKKVIFAINFEILCKKKGFAHGGISKICFQDHFSSSF